jgi:hypothetical protein
MAIKNQAEAQTSLQQSEVLIKSCDLCGGEYIVTIPLDIVSNVEKAALEAAAYRNHALEVDQGGTLAVDPGH